MKPAASIIISTYNAEAWLEKVLWGYAAQTRADFEILIADDGSGPATAEVIQRYAKLLPMPLVHIWHADQGFRKTEILNKAIEAATADYLIFSDGDCIPRNDFVDTHLKLRQTNRFLSGGYFKLPMDISMQITRQDVDEQKCFEVEWLTKNGLKSSIKNWKLTKNTALANVLNALTPTRPSWNGHNASAWRNDVLALNGFNRDMQYGGEDREFGERLENYGVRGLQIRYRAIVIHLDHARGYVKPEMWEKNNAIRANTRKHKVVQTPRGIKNLSDNQQ